MMKRLLNVAYKYNCNIIYDFEDIIIFHEDSYRCYCTKDNIFISKLLIDNNDEVLLFLVLHEILHIIGKSFLRFDKYYFSGGFSHLIFNYQEDLLINDYLQKELPQAWKDLNNKTKQINDIESDECIYIDSTNFKSIVNKTYNLSSYLIYNEWIKDNCKEYKLYNKVCEIGIKKIEQTFVHIINKFDNFNENSKYLNVVVNDFNQIPNKYVKVDISNLKSKFKIINLKQLIYKNKIIKITDDNKKIFEKDLFLLWTIMNNLDLLGSDHDKNIKCLEILYICIMNKEINNINISFLNILEDLDKKNNSNNSNSSENQKIKEELKNYENIFDTLSKFNSLPTVDLDNLMVGKEDSIFVKEKKKYKLKKIDKRKISEFEKIILNYIDKFFIRSGISRTYKRPHRLIENLKGRVHKKRNFKNIQIFLDHSGSMSGKKINILRDCYFSIHKTLQRKRMLGYYYVFNTKISKPHTYEQLLKENYGADGGTKINNVLKELKSTNYNIIVTDGQDIIDFNLIDKNIKILWFIIGSYNLENIEERISKNIKVINLPA